MTIKCTEINRYVLCNKIQYKHWYSIRLSPAVVPSVNPSNTQSHTFSAVEMWFGCVLSVRTFMIFQCPCLDFLSVLRTHTPNTKRLTLIISTNLSTSSSAIGSTNRNSLMILYHAKYLSRITPNGYKVLLYNTKAPPFKTGFQRLDGSKQFMMVHCALLTAIDTDCSELTFDNLTVQRFYVSHLRCIGEGNLPLYTRTRYGKRQCAVLQYASRGQWWVQNTRGPYGRVYIGNPKFFEAQGLATFLP